MTFNQDLARIKQDLANALGVDTPEQRLVIDQWFRRNFEIVTSTQHIATQVLMRTEARNMFDHMLTSSAARIGALMAKNRLVSFEQMGADAYSHQFRMDFCALKRVW